MRQVFLLSRGGEIKADGNEKQEASPMTRDNSIDGIGKKIVLLRGSRVMLSSHLAELYSEGCPGLCPGIRSSTCPWLQATGRWRRNEVEPSLDGVATKVLVQGVRRNIARFPSDFMFQLTWQEVQALRSQIVTLDGAVSKRGKHFKYPPYAFTQEGVAMLSSVLRSSQAVQVNIAIMRAFVRLKRAISSKGIILQKLDRLESRVDKHDGEIEAIFEAIRRLMIPPGNPKKRIGFHPLQGARVMAG